MDNKHYALIDRKDRGGLKKPSDDLVTILEYTEMELQRLIPLWKKKKPGSNEEIKLISNSVIKRSTDSNIFPDLINIHVNKDDHKVVLINLIIQKFMKIRMHQVITNLNEARKGVTIRKTYKKMVHFKNQ